MFDHPIVAMFAVIFGLLGISMAFTEISKRYIAYRERKLELMADKTAERAAQYAAQVERLEARMRVLERIATDKGVDVAAQIEALRDQEEFAPRQTGKVN